MFSLFVANSFQISFKTAFYFSLNNYTEKKNRNCFYYQHCCYFWLHQIEFILLTVSTAFITRKQMEFVDRLTLYTKSNFTYIVTYEALQSKAHTCCTCPDECYG